MITAGLESLLIFVVFILVSGLSTWLQKRRAAGEEEWKPGPGPTGGQVQNPRQPGAPSRPSAPRRPIPAPLQNWEEELRRLLEGDSYRPPPSPPPQAAPPPLTASPRHPAATPAPRRAPVVQPAPMATRRGAAETERASRLEESEQAYRRARRQQAEAEARLRQAQAKVAHHQAASRTGPRHLRGEIRAARALLSTPSSARQAVIASVILGQPKGLE